MSKTEKHNIAAVQAAVRESITFHGGPWVGCDGCYYHAEETRASIVKADFDDKLVEWQRHLVVEGE